MKFKLEDEKSDNDLEITLFLRKNGNMVHLMAKDNREDNTYFVLNIYPNGFSRIGALPRKWPFVGEDGCIQDKDSL